MALKLIQTVVDCLKKHPEQRFTARAIAEWVFKNHPDECREKQKRSTAKVTLLDTDNAMIQQLAAEIGAQRHSLQNKDSQIKTTEGRPRKYYFTKDSDSEEVEQADETMLANETSLGSGKPSEHDLYPLLSRFLWIELRIASKRIDEKKSKNINGKGGNKWLHPDLVGMEDLSQDWGPEVKTCFQELGETRARLWSFEVKTLINRSNVREAFFQAVSNSSWAHLGYLVTGEITGVDTLKELRMLSSLHGIGVIQLEAEVSDSQIIIPARERAEIDWESANRLAVENKDFLDYIQVVTEFYQIGKMKSFEWDYDWIKETPDLL